MPLAGEKSHGHAGVSFSLVAVVTIFVTPRYCFSAYIVVAVPGVGRPADCTVADQGEAPAAVSRCQRGYAAEKGVRRVSRINGYHIRVPTDTEEIIGRQRK